MVGEFEKIARENGKICWKFCPETQSKCGNQVTPSKYEIECQKVIQRANKLILSMGNEEVFRPKEPTILWT